MLMRKGMNLAFDIKILKPACVLVAAGYGADTELAHRFDPHHWQLTPTPDMKVYEVTEHQLEQLVNMVEREHGKAGSN
jgi:hypothetical protein